MFRCTVPKTIVDVRLHAAGLAPRYFWGVTEPNLGDVVLTRGGSIAGTLRFDGDGPPLDAVKLQLTPATPPRMDPAWQEGAKRLAVRAVTLRPNTRGFFQFTEVEAGRYTIFARHDGWSRARITNVEVTDGEETSLPQPLVLQPFAEVDVFIHPALDPYGKPWQVALSEMVPMSSLTTPIVETEASLSGTWAAAGIEAGAHRIDVRDHRGNRFAYSIVDVSPRMPPVQIEIDGVIVRGTVRVGDAPLRAHLQFRNGRGTMIAMRSDTEGRFAGALPESGKWEVDVFSGERTSRRRTVEVHTEQGVAELSIHLPDTRIGGKVVSPSGEPVASFVRLLDDDRKYIGGTRSGEDGAFEITGIEPGRIYVEAESRASADARSGLLPVTVGVASTEELTIVLRPASRLRGRLRTPSGVPVAGAIVRYLLSDRRGHTMEEVSGPDGTFAISLAPGTAAADLAILPPALPVKIVRVATRSDSSATTEIVLGAPSGILEIELDHRGPYPWIEHEGVTHNVGSLRYPAAWTGMPRGAHPWGQAIEIEAGVYTLCGDAAMRTRCVRKTIESGSVERVDGRGLLR